MTLVSVIVRTLGRPRMAEALASIAEQSWPDLEVVVVDMSSHGMSKEISRYPRRIHTIKAGRPLNRSVALNLAIQHCEGSLIGILDDDNLYTPPHIERLVGALESTKSDMVYTGILRQTLAPSGTLMSEEAMDRDYDYIDLLSGNYIYASGVLFSKRIWSRIGGYDIRFPVYEDWDFYIRLGNAGKIRHVEGFTAISRNFTGVIGSSSHIFETTALKRSYQGILWKHRKLRKRSVAAPRLRENNRSGDCSSGWTSSLYRRCRSTYRDLRSGSWKGKVRNAWYLLCWQVEHGPQTIIDGFWSPFS